MIVNLRSDDCLICLEKCKNTIKFECCGEYVIHDKCYKKWRETNQTCLICRDSIVENTNFVLQYVTLARIKIVVSCYCVLMFTSFIYIIIVCDFSRDYCDLM
jgi:flagellar biosynthesis protein FliP